MIHNSKRLQQKTKKYQENENKLREDLTEDVV